LFGGGCVFGINDKVGFVENLWCWILICMIKEMFVVDIDYCYLYMIGVGCSVMDVLGFE